MWLFIRNKCDIEAKLRPKQRIIMHFVTDYLPKTQYIRENHVKSVQ